jgi:HK97 family phage portal protein
MPTISQLRADMSRRARFTRYARLSAGGQLGPPNPWGWLTGDVVTDNQPRPATEYSAMGYPPFGRGVALLASAVATTRWIAERWDPALGVSVPLADQPAVLTDPFPDGTPWAYKWAVIEDGILYGNHFALYGDMDFRTRRPGWLLPLRADEVWVLEDPENLNWSWVVGGDEISRDAMFHIPFGNRSGFILGRGVLEQYSEWLGGALAAEDYAGMYFAGGTLPPAVLQSPNVLTPEQAKDLKASWREMTNTHEPVVMPTGYTLTPVVSNAEQAQLVESRRWTAEMVGMMLGIPSWKLGLPGPTMTYQNVETGDIDYVRDGVDRYSAPVAAAFTKHLTPAGTSVRFDWTSRQRADTVTTQTTLVGYVGAGIMTKDEARAVIGRPPLPDAPDEPPAPDDVPDDGTPAEPDESTTAPGVPELSPASVNDRNAQ